MPAILCAVYTFFYLPNYPQTVDFLSEDEREAILGYSWQRRLGYLVRATNCYIRAGYLEYRDIASHDYGESSRRLGGGHLLTNISHRSHLFSLSFAV